MTCDLPTSNDDEENSKNGLMLMVDVGVDVHCVVVVMLLGEVRSFSPSLVNASPKHKTEGIADGGKKVNSNSNSFTFIHHCRFGQW